MSAIDIHTHAFPDDLAKRAIASLEEGCPWKAVANGTIKALLKSMDAADIDLSVICAIATKPQQVEGILEWCREIRSDRIEPFPSVHPDTPQAAQWVRKFAQEGFLGIKLHPMYQDFAADSERAGPIYEAARECNLAVEVHCGRDIAFPATDDRASSIRMRQVIDRFPGLKLVCMHMGGWRTWEASLEHLAGTSVYLETSFSLDELGPDKAAQMIRRHGVDKVMFGTDWPWQSQKDALGQLKALDLTEEEMRKLTWSNATKLLGY
jgi:uncharacterized protein